MSLYNMLFGQNPPSVVILATLGLTKAEVGRFRDCYVADGKIVVYTRNGGGNRVCSHAGYEEYGDAGCRNEPFQKEMRETEKREGGATECGCGSNVWIGSGHLHYTGKTILQKQYRCLAPESEECACTGCTIQYRLPKHPNYLSDVDDDYDCTYATIYFSLPGEYADGLRALDSGAEWNPNEQWENLISALEKGSAA